MKKAQQLKPKSKNIEEKVTLQSRKVEAARNKVSAVLYQAQILMERYSL
ncbi:MAG: hypothetical protein Q9M36_14095 [Sulfurovum sp.]|nr:hypothetical protein [Sulfurovum sp.]